MNRKIIVEPFTDTYNAVGYYCIRFAEDEDNEFEKFVSIYSDKNGEHIKSFDRIMGWLNEIGDKGNVDLYLRDEGGRVRALPLKFGRLRLYCYKVSDSIIILGNGGYKSLETQAYQDDKHLNQCVQDLKKVGKLLLERVNKKEDLSIDRCKLSGNLKFEIDSK